jgi:hypothetical protein
MDLIPLDDDLLSLELPQNFRNHLLQEENTEKLYVSNSLNRIEQMFGGISHKYGIGPAASDFIN